MPPTVTALARSQETLWEFVRCFAPDDPGCLGYNVFGTMPLTGPVDLPVFRAAVRDVARRHDALRIVFETIADDPLIRIEDEVEPIVTFVDLSGEPAGRVSARRGSVLGYESGRAFDLRQGPSWSVTLVRSSRTDYTVTVSMFHLIADGWSTGVFLRDLAAALAARTGQGGPLPELPLRYADATAVPRWSAAERRRRTEFWQRQLTPLPEALPFPGVGEGVGGWSGGTDCPGADAGRYAGLDVTATAKVTIGLPADLARRLHGYARQHRMTPFVLSLAAYRVLLGAMTGWPRLVLGTATSGRDEPGATELVGQFTHNIYVATTIPLRTTLADAVAEVRTSTFAAMRQVASFKEIAQAVNPGFAEARPWPFLLLYHSWFQSAPPAGGAPGGRAGAGDEVREQRSRGRLPVGAEIGPDRRALWAKRGEPGMTVSDDRRSAELNYNPTCYDRDAVVDAVRGYRVVLEELLRDPNQRISDLKLS
ncbi:condensation domain-containing protein [Plantactinospora sp. KLBMP9567]|uniref:condensation domain-containing protein n=1 Tax=Plantactinospora sp. KLBMP9567 TaxID=3085900 RepID=UPI0029824121|nr:condensation domain-containing protein [Plantactinospora sp. KLBMP9567]MDW5322255.1 condensation domain-containing protein [Plantactinospora sp. KLBMP9567]